MSQIPYRVLARKYRPQSFAELIGQDAMVRTLKNAIDTGRLAHAFILTGVRGIGKTTTARLIARALNCVGPDGKGKETVEPCGVCEFCASIAESRAPDVIEMDAASHTGVDDVRAIIENVPYAAASARYKVYIIDEVHMLSKSAFNALLKTLEEPPGHVKFIFATTEIRKVPVTVLSRCQRFDLKRVDVGQLVGHFGKIVEKEGAKAEEAALALIARASEGSVRDGLSLLDQAIAHSGGEVTAEQVRSMIGLADRAAVIDLYADLMEGRLAEAIKALGAQYNSGADPLIVLEDMLAFTHWLTRLKVAPEAADAPGVSETERERGKTLAESLSMASLTKNWQLLLKGLDEVRGAPSGLAAAEMVLVRLAHAATLPNPADLIRKLQSGAAAASAGGPPAGKPNAPRDGGNVTAIRPQQPQKQAEADPQTFEQLVQLFEDRKEGLLGIALRDHCHLVQFAPGALEIRPTERCPRDLASRMMLCLEAWTGRRWHIVMSADEGAASLRQQEEAAQQALEAEALARPEVKQLFAAFPGARLVAVKRRDYEPAPAFEVETAASGDIMDDYDYEDWMEDVD